MQQTFGNNVQENVTQEMEGLENDQEETQEMVAPVTAIVEEEEYVNGSDGVYVVEDGDTLAVISMKMYGDLSHVDAICKMNGLTDGNFIYIGQKLVLP